MTDTGHRVAAVVVAALVFLVAWAAVAARPWAAGTDPRLAALALREQRLRADAAIVQQVVARRDAAYRAALQARRAQIAAARAPAHPPPAPPTGRGGNHPPRTHKPTAWCWAGR
jgi:hypothetical protein